jgi:PAS domain S-box-containing protein
MHDLEKLFQLSTDMLCVAGVDGRFRRVNPAFSRVLGWTSAELIAVPLTEFVHPDDRQRTLDEIAALEAGRTTLHFENRYRCKDGSYRWLAWTSTPDIDAGVLYAVARDVTGAKQSLEDLMKDLPGMVYRCFNDPHWTLAYVSSGARALTGHSPEVLLAEGGPTLAGITHPDDLQRVRDEIAAALSESREYEIEYRIRTATGEEKLVWERGRTIDHGDGRPMLQGFIADITERRRLRSEIQQLQKMEALGQLTGGIAHDFNNLLTVVIGNIELLEALLRDVPEGAEHLRDAMEAAWRGVELGQRLLAFSRKQMLAPEVVSVNALLLGMESLLKRTLGAGVAVDLAVDDRLPLVRVDPGQLENAILNLAINARDAMPEGGTLRIRTGRFKADKRYAAARADVSIGPYVMIEVSDTGTGMTPEVRERAFEPFFTTKERGKGTGLGLSMVYGLLQQSGGHARVYSELGHGTSVKLYLPEIVAGEQEAPTNTIRLLREHGGNAECVLVVEDDEPVRRLVVNSLRELGYQTLEADSAPAGLKVLAAQGRNVHLLLTDLVMPGGMDGLQLARESRSLYPHLKVLLTSGFSEEHASVQGELPLLSKPYRKAELARAVRHALTEQAYS